MITRSGLAAIVLLATLCAGCRVNGQDGQPGQPGDSASGGDGDGQTTTTSYQVPQPITEIRVDAGSGDVRVIPDDGPIAVTETAHYTDDKPPTSHVVTGSTLALQTRPCRHVRVVNGRCQVDWEVHAPAGTTLDLRSGSGDITVRGFSGTVTTQVGSGTVKAEDLAARSVHARSGSGDVELTFTQVPDDVRAKAGSGDVDLTLPGGTGYDVRTETGAGDADVAVQRADGSPHKIKAETGSGSIEIRNR